MKKILVIGSLNMDTVIETPYMPKSGETLTGKGVTLIPGGKGANQAYAAGKLGGCVSMIGAVADDSFGKMLKDNLNSVGVDTTGVATLPGATTGQAFITVDGSGANSIILIPGTNGMVSKEMIDAHRDLIASCDIVMMQLEIDWEVAAYAKDLAVSLGKLVIVDPAPALPNLPDSFWQGVDYIKPNETELEILTGHSISGQEALEAAAGMMLAKGVKNVMVSLGGDGCLLVNQSGTCFYPAHKVKAVDTTAAGDCFTASFAVALSKGESVADAIRFGQKASSIAVTRKGAQTSIPSLEEVLADY
ncbi:MAG: ribokinase [Oscillospiraceae bacterium]|nr:ribokinase [Oscillospiraceae bacterium]MBQ9148230.1 ribokinase [Oscillospiraceae bacterium]